MKTIDYNFGIRESIQRKLEKYLAPEDSLRQTDFIEQLSKQLKGPHTPAEFWAAWGPVNPLLRQNLPNHTAIGQFKRECLELLCENRRFIRQCYIANDDITHMDADDFRQWLFENPIIRWSIVLILTPVILAFAGAVASLMVGNIALTIMYGFSILFYWGFFMVLILSFFVTLAELLIDIGHHFYQLIGGLGGLLDRLSTPKSRRQRDRIVLGAADYVSGIGTDHGEQLLGR